VKIHKTVILLITTLIFITSSLAIAQSKDVEILVDNVNVREGPSTEFHVIKKVHSNEQYPFIESDNDWLKIDLGKQSGWVLKEYVDVLSKEESKKEISETEQYITVHTDQTHIRKGPSTNYDILTFVNKGEQLPVLTTEEDWFKIEINDDTGYIHQSFIEQNNEEHVLRNKTIIIDPGHGGYDVGAISVSERYEKDFALITAKKLKDILTELGVNVIMTREHDEYIRLGSRVSMSNLINPDLFISIHYNSFPDFPSAKGISTFYYDENDKKLAKSVQRQTILATNANDRDVSYENLQVLRHNHNRAILMELGFLSNVEEEKLLQSNEYQEKLVKGIIAGLVDYFRKE